MGARCLRDSQGYLPGLKQLFGAVSNGYASFPNLMGCGVDQQLLDESSLHLDRLKTGGSYLLC